MKDVLFITHFILHLSLSEFCFCGFREGKANTTYTWSYTGSDGQTHSGEFTTNEYGQGSFDTPTGVDCSKVQRRGEEDA